MTQYTESGSVEDFIIQELQKLGWKYIDSKGMNEIREKNFEEPLVLKIFKSSLERINEVKLTDEDFNYIIQELKIIQPNLNGIERFLDILRNGMIIQLQNEKEAKTIKLIDLDNIENNDFIVTNQYRVEEKEKRIPDIVLLVNGIPLVSIQCKNPAKENVSWFDAYKDLKDDEKSIPEFMKFVQFSIATDGNVTKYFPNCFLEEGKDEIGEWKDPYPFKKEDLKNDPLKITIYGLLSKQNLLDIIENFIFVDKKEGKKMMARYMQFRAVNKIFNRVVSTLEGKENKKSGLIWHWQGSGKTFIMAIAARKLQRCVKTRNPTIFIVVDRKHMETQIMKDFESLGIKIERIKKINHLIEILRWGEGGKRGIFLTTIEKFRHKEFEKAKKEGRVEVERDNVIIFTDESHRSQYGDLAAVMRSVFKNAFIFGFTGTPIQKGRRNTFEKFCPTGEFYLDRYTMQESIEDGFTLPLTYEARLPDYHLNQEQLSMFYEFEEKEIKPLSPEEKRALKRKIRVIKAIIKEQNRIEKIVRDIVEHFKNVVEPTGLKAMIVTVDREACVKYKRILDKYLDPQLSEIVMSLKIKGPKDVEEYSKELFEKFGTTDEKAVHERIEENFKNGEKPKILIVTDMLLEGFNARNLFAMYIDKPLREHRLLQAITRTNRPAPNKKYGLVVDYIGVLDDLDKALEKYEKEEIVGLVIRKIDEIKEEFEKILNETLRIFEGVKREDTKESLDEALSRLEDPKIAEKFEELMKKLMEIYEILGGNPIIVKYLSDYKWLNQIYIAYYNKYKRAKIDELKIEVLSKKTIELIQKTINVKEIEKNYPIVEIDRKYLEELKLNPPKDRAAAIDVFANILAKVERSPRTPFFINLKKEIEKTYEELRSKKIRTEEAIKKILGYAEKIVKWDEEKKRIGEKKYFLYDAVISIYPQIEKEFALNFVEKLLEDLEKEGLFPNWFLQRDEVRKVKSKIRLLIKTSFPQLEEKIDELVDALINSLKLIKW